MKAVSLVVHGRVQGVWYRDWAVQTARELGVLGWVRNCQDGTVAALLQGDADAVERLIERMRSGPPAARVERIDRVNAEPGDFSSFTRR